MRASSAHFPAWFEAASGFHRAETRSANSDPLPRLPDDSSHFRTRGSWPMKEHEVLLRQEWRRSSSHRIPAKGVDPMLILLIILIVLLAGSVPAWPYSRSWGYYPSGSLGTVLVILIILIVLGIVPLR